VFLNEKGKLQNLPIATLKYFSQLARFSLIFDLIFILTSKLP